jgi:hypothetical protein
MFGPAPLQRLSLPEEFALLPYGEDGRVPNPAQAAAGCAATELGELALRGSLLIRPRKTRKLGLETCQPRGEIELRPNTPGTDLTWADGLLAALHTRATTLTPAP